MRILLIAVCFFTLSCSPNIPKSEFKDLGVLFPASDTSLPSYLVELHKRDVTLNMGSKKEDSVVIHSAQNVKIILKLLNSKHLQVKMYNEKGDTVKRNFRGKYAGKFFKVKKRYSLEGNPLLWYLGSSSNLFAKNIDGNILIYHSRGSCGFFTLIPLMGTGFEEKVVCKRETK